jgi:hypothetical protein
VFLTDKNPWVPITAVRFSYHFIINKIKIKPKKQKNKKTNKKKKKKKKKTTSSSKVSVCLNGDV